MNESSTTPASPRWLHVLAVLTVLCTLPLLFLGAGVTTHGVGMVDPQGFRPPWVIINALFENSGFDWRLEYGHRTFGFLVGLCAIALVAGCWLGDRRTWLTGFAVAALALICLQGLLGIFRVDFNALYGKNFAMMHGMLAQIVFATLVSLMLFTSRRWSVAEPVSPAVQRWSIVTMLLVFTQLMLGGVVRHQESLLGPRGHLLGAFLVTAAVAWLIKLMLDHENRGAFRWQVVALVLLLGLQLLLGVESWLARFYVPRANLPQLAPLPTHAEWVRTMHYLVGTLLFGKVVVVALLAHRRAVVVGEVITPRHELEAAQ